MASLKGPGEAQSHDGSSLRIAIVHARWNATLISALVSGCKASLHAAGVRDSNIVVQSVPGSYELPLAVSRIYGASTVQASTSGRVSATDLLTSLTSSTELPASLPESQEPSAGPFDAIIAIGVLIKGETMHFEYIADAVSHGLMRVQLDLGVPVVFGLLTVLTEEQGKARAGLSEGGHNHGEDWGAAAVELAVKSKEWREGKIS